MGRRGRKRRGAHRIGQPADDRQPSRRSRRLGEDVKGNGRRGTNSIESHHRQEPRRNPRRRREDQRDMRQLSRKVSAVGATHASALLVLFIVLLSATLDAHGVSGKDAVYLQGLQGRAVGPLMYLGAKHMVTGYDHLLFLVGVIFFLYRLKDILLYVSLFTIGHSLTLLIGAIGGVRANPYLIDAVIGLSIVYKGFENLGGFRRFLGFQPNTRIAVLVFGLFHGFGLATKLQEFALARNGLVTNIVSFNVGVEIGQLLALTAVLLGLTYWRTRSGYLRHAYFTNAVLMTAGFVLAGYQVAGFFVATR